MFGFRKKDKLRHEFDEQDREHAQLMREAKREMQRIEIENLRREVKHLRDGERRGRPHKTGASSLLKQFQDLDELRDYLSPEQEQQADQMGGLMPFVLTLLQQQNRTNKVPETQSALQEALKQQGKRRKKGDISKNISPDTTSLVLERLPPTISSGIASGKIPKAIARSYGHKLADQEIDKIYNLLQKKDKK